MDIYLIRHTAVAVERGICYGQTDVELASTAAADIEHTLNKLPAKFDVVYASPLMRCKILALKISPSPIFDDRLKELHFGDWEMKWWEKMEADALAQFRADFVNTAAPNGESYTDMLLRCASFYKDRITESHSNIAIVTHGGVIKTLLCHLLDMPQAQTFERMIDYGSVTKLNLNNGEIKLDYINR